ncbi:MAG: hypothetical protein KKF39_06975 [Nanoarchaeota archaeon]|nr:hypothetical protein [Nanoarchaeota archaeon]
MSSYSSIPEGYEKFEVVLIGGASDSGRTLYILACDAKHAHAWADEASQEYGYNNFAVTSEKEQKERMAQGDEKYKFSWPRAYSIVDASLPARELVHFVSKESQAHLFDADAMHARQQEERKAHKAKRAGRAVPLSEGETS